MGFQRLETPLFEGLKTLTEKYGEEGDQLLFKVLRSGDFLQKKADQEALVYDSRALARSERAAAGLRWRSNCTFARVVANINLIHHLFEDIDCPFLKTDRSVQRRLPLMRTRISLGLLLGG